MESQTYRMIAIQVGETLKYDTSINQVQRAASAVFKFSYEEFPTQGITSERARLIHNWIMSLAKQHMTETERNEQLNGFLRMLFPHNRYDELDNILDSVGATNKASEKTKLFINEGFHYLINQNCKELYVNGHYFHSVFEAAKVYHKQVQQKANSSKDGQALMMDVWNPNTGCLKITPCISETDKNIQEGIGFLSTGLMRAIRNPTAHEPAMDWPINENDCLDVLSFISFLLRKLDDAVYVSPDHRGIKCYK